MDVWRVSGTLTLQRLYGIRPRYLVQQLRRGFLKRMEDNHKEMIEKAGIRRVFLKESFKRLKEGCTPDDFDLEPFRQLLLCIPFFLYADIVLYYLDLNNGDGERYRKYDISEADEDGIRDLLDGDWEWCSVFYSLVKIGLYLRHDKEWLNTNSKALAIVMQSDDPVAVEEMLDITLVNINGFVGEWFEKEKEFRAAIWCYNHNMEYVQDEHLVNLLSNIALANKRMDNFSDAFKYYEEALILGSATGTSQHIMTHLYNNANMLQQAVKDWFGTSGHLPSWSFTPEDVSSLETNNKCQSCKAEGATKSCSACHLVCYCNTDCQKEHWKKVHKRTCVGKMRNKK
jgi:hypothetical protein